MKHYKDTQNNLFGFEDGDVVPIDLVEITMDEVNSINTAKQQAAFDALTTTEKNALREASRKAAYTAEADPLFFQFQRGIIKEQVWLDKIAEIKTRYPKE
jgi:hypothetical protein